MFDLTDENFDEMIRKSKIPVLVDFFAIWCPPCTILSPILENLEKEYEGKLIFAKVNVDTAPQVSQKFGINPIPTVILIKDEKTIDGFVGVRPEPAIKEWLEKYVKN